MRISAQDTMALIVDYQEKLMPVMNNGRELLENSVKLLQGLKELDIPMVVTQQYTKGLGMTVPELTEVIGEEFTYLDKLSFSCGQDSEILTKIQANGKKNIIVCGIEAHICVLQTVIDLIELGYQVILVEDCISSRKESDKSTALKRAMSEGAILTTCESILFELTRAAGTDVFKAISKIIK